MALADDYSDYRAGLVQSLYRENMTSMLNMDNLTHPYSTIGFHKEKIPSVACM